MSWSTRQVCYSAGSWTAVVGERLWLLADLAAAEPLVRRCWDLVQADTDVDEVIAAIMHEGFRAVDSFAVLRHHGETTHVVIRGSAEVRLYTPTEEVVELRTAGAADWVDRSLHQSFSGFRLLGRSPTDAASGALPVVGGVVRAAALDVLLDASGSWAPPRAAVPEVAPAAPAPPTALAAHTGPEPAHPPMDLPASTSVAESGPTYHDLFQETQGAMRESAPYQAESFYSAPPSPSTTPAAVEPPSTVTPAVPEWRPSTSATLQPVDTDVPDRAYPSGRDAGLIEDVSWALPDAAALPSHQPSSGQVAFGYPDPRPHSDEAGDVSLTVRRQRPVVSDSAESNGPVMLATRCPKGHLNASDAYSCRVCHARVLEQIPSPAARPQLGVLRLSTGDVIPLDRGVIMGRDPDVPAGHDGERPHVVRLPSPGKDISRRHLEVRLDGWRVLIVDLGSTNGTFVTSPGGSAEQIPPHSGRALEHGAVVSLADDVSFTFEVTG